MPEPGRQPDEQNIKAMKESVRRMWDEYRVAMALAASAPMPSDWHFCDEQPEDECERLVVVGRRRTSAPSLWGFHSRDETVPTAGTLTSWQREVAKRAQ